ncbi:MAG: peroxidase [Pseudonocardia sp.]|nr:peroxidase [Pseudonocardia sp.]
MLIEPDGHAVQEEARAWEQEQAAQWGYVPNYAAAFVSRPEVARAWLALSAAVRGGMDRRRYEVATIAAAMALRNTYCTAAHAGFLRDACGDEATMRAIAADPTGGSLDETDRAVYGFATKVARDAAGITSTDVDDVRAAGLSDNDVADVVFAVAARRFFATVLDAVGVLPDHQLGAAFDPAVAEQLTVGRPFADASGGGS